MTTTTTETTPELTAPAREAVRDLILVLADSKRLLGMRYAEWMLGAADLEAGIACAAMTQDEWGHARLFYAMLKDFGEDTDALEHDREPGEYYSMEALDRSPDGWPRLVVLNALVDTALSAQCEALRGSSYGPLAQRVEKLLDEETFHFAHGAAWFRRLAGAGDDSRAALAAAVNDALPTLLRWFGPDSERAAALREAGIADAVGSELRARYLERIAPILDISGDDIAAARMADATFDDFDETARRVSREGPDAETIAKVRGDKSEPFRL